MDKQLIREYYFQLLYYTLTHPDPAFIHQLVVDAFTAQQADNSTKPIAIVFALVGLHLHIDKGYSGKAVQQAHIQLAKQRKHWPVLPLPEERGDITVADVVATKPGDERDALIESWCKSVWNAYHSVQDQIRAFVQKELFDFKSQ